MKNTKNIKNTTGKKRPRIKSKKKLPGYEPYPQSEDIYHKEKRDDQINPDDGTAIKEENVEKEPAEENLVTGEEKKDILSGDDLDVPGSELDDSQEDIGEEDEENNYYSLGGDNHDD